MGTKWPFNLTIAKVPYGRYPKIEPAMGHLVPLGAPWHFQMYLVYCCMVGALALFPQFQDAMVHRLMQT